MAWGSEPRWHTRKKKEKRLRCFSELQSVIALFSFYDSFFFFSALIRRMGLLHGSCSGNTVKHSHPYVFLSVSLSLLILRYRSILGFLAGNGLFRFTMTAAHFRVLFSASRPFCFLPFALFVSHAFNVHFSAIFFCWFYASLLPVSSCFSVKAFLFLFFVFVNVLWNKKKRREERERRSKYLDHSNVTTIAVTVPLPCFLKLVF